MLYSHSKKIISLFKYVIPMTLATCVSLNAHGETLTKTASGLHDGFYYNFYKENGNANFTLEAGGRYIANWDQSTNNWIGGKGWQPGGAKLVTYSGTYGINSNTNSYLALYGWTSSPTVEYYIVESWGSYDPTNCPTGKLFGRYQSDGANYELFECKRNGPVLDIHIDPPPTRFYSMRVPKKSFGAINGTIDTARHFNEWKKLGANLGKHDYMILATEGYQSRGGVDLTVDESSSSSSNSSSSSSSNSSSSSSSGVSINTSSSSSGISATGGATVGGTIDTRLLLISLLGFVIRRRRRNS